MLKEDLQRIGQHRSVSGFTVEMSMGLIKMRKKVRIALPCATISRLEDRMSTPKKRLAFVVPSRVALVDEVCQMVSDFFSNLGFTGDDVYAFDLSLREAVINAMKHGNHWDEALTVGVLVDVTGNNCVIRVRDSGRYHASIPETPENLVASNGRGLVIMRSMMCRIGVNRVPPFGAEYLLRFVQTK